MVVRGMYKTFVRGSQSNVITVVVVALVVVEAVYMMFVNRTRVVMA